MDRYFYGTRLVLPPPPPATPDRDVATDGSVSEVDAALRAAWDAVSVRWHDAALAYSYADLSTAVDDDGAVRPDRVAREMRRVAQAHRWLVNTAPAYDVAAKRLTAGPSGSNVGSGRRQTPAWVPTRATLAQHQARPAHDHGGGRIPADYPSPR